VSERKREDTEKERERGHRERVCECEKERERADPNLKTKQSSDIFFSAVIKIFRLFNVIPSDSAFRN